MQSKTLRGVTITFSDSNEIVKVSGDIVTLKDGTKINLRVGSIIKFGSDRQVKVKE